MVGIRKESTAYTQQADLGRENKDCHVRAVAIVANMDYEESHALHKKHGRKDRCATYYNTTNAIVSELNLRKLNVRRSGKFGKDRYPTVKQFVWDHPKGRFLVHRSGHAFAIIDGVVHDWAHGTGPRSRIVWAAEVQI